MGSGEAGAELKRVLGFAWLYTLAVGAVIGDGIFTFTGYAMVAAGAAVIASYLIAGITQMFLMISFGELVVWKPSAGGPEPWVSHFYGPRLGFLASITFSIGWIIAGGSTSLALGTYIYTMLSYAGIELGNQALWVTVFALLFVILFALLNIVGVAIAAGTQFILTALLIGIMVGYAVSATFYINPHNFSNPLPQGLGGIIAAIPPAVYAFMGASTVVFAGEEARKPVDIARVLLWSSVTFVIVYTWALVGLVGTLPYDEVVKFYSVVYATSAYRLWGWVGGMVIAFAAWLAASTCLLMGTMYQPARDLYGLAKRGYRVPKWFGYVHPAFGTPTYNIILVLAVSITLIMLGTFVGHTLGYMLLGYQLVWAWIISWLLTLLAAYKFRKTYPHIVEQLPWKVPGWPVTPAIGFIGIALTVFAMFYDLVVGYGPTIAAVTGVVSIVWVLVLWILARYIVPRTS